jgi:hypothetical protein
LDGVRSRRSRPLAPLALACLLGGLGAAAHAWTQTAARAEPGQALRLDPGEDNQPSTVNTIFDEREPALSQDGRLLLFSSNRGGQYGIFGVLLPGGVPGPGVSSEAIRFVPPPRGSRALPEVQGLGGPGAQRSPCLCEKTPGGPDRYELVLFYRSEEAWGAGLYAAELEAMVLEGGASEGRLVLGTGAVRPLLQGLGRRLEGPWWVPQGAWAGPGALLLAREAGRWLGWRLHGCRPEPVSERDLLGSVPLLDRAAQAASLAWAGPGQLLLTGRGVRARLDFAWAGEEAFGLSRSLAGATVNTDGWNELEAAFGPSRGGRRLLIFSRDATPTRRSGDLYYTWLGPGSE